MKKFIVLISILIIAVLIPLVAVNYIIDSGNVWHSEKICQTILSGFKQGKNVTNVVDLNERMLKEKLVELHKGDSIDYIIIGASRVMTISSDVFGGKVILNLGMSGSKIEDLIAVTQLCEDNNVSYNKVIIGAEPTYFNAKDGSTSWLYLKKYYDSFLGKYNSNYTAPKNRLTLISLSYFQSNIQTLPALIKGKRSINYVDSYINDGMTYRIDGSIYYSKDYRERPHHLIDEESRTWMHESFNNYDNISFERVELFDRLVRVLLERGYDVIFFKCPYHPDFYSRIFKIHGVVEGESLMDSIAQKYDINIIGSYNSEDVHFTNQSFYDAAHVRKESIDKLFSNYLQ